MIKNKDSLKAKASNLAKKTDIPNKYIIQNFMFETLLKRIVKSQYKDKFFIIFNFWCKFKKYYGFRYYN